MFKETHFWPSLKQLTNPHPAFILEGEPSVLHNLLLNEHVSTAEIYLS